MVLVNILTPIKWGSGLSPPQELGLLHSSLSPSYLCSDQLLSFPLPAQEKFCSCPFVHIAILHLFLGVQQAGKAGHIGNLSFSSGNRVVAPGERTSDSSRSSLTGRKGVIAGNFASRSPDTTVHGWSPSISMKNQPYKITTTRQNVAG